MKKYVFLAFFALIAFVVKAQDESGDLVKEGQQMPAFTIMNDNGTQVPSSSLKGKVILVNFFATWCPPCQKVYATKGYSDEEFAELMKRIEAALK